MAFTFAALRAGLGTALSTIDDVNVYTIAPGQLQTPALLVIPGEPYWDRDQAMGRGMAIVNYEVGVLLSLANMAQAQTNLDALLDDVVDALLADRTLGGACDDLTVPQVSGFDDAEIGGTSLLAARVSVRIFVDES